MKIRQGDVTLIKVAELPENAELVKTHILQASEVSGNFHKFKPTADVAIYETLKVASGDSITPDMGKFVQVNETSWMFHGKQEQYDDVPANGDHTSLKVPPGIYKVHIAREYDYDREETRQVIDWLIGVLKAPFF